jgi:hypothetical protein
MSAVSSTFRAHYSMHAEQCAISLSLNLCQSNQGSLAISVQVWNSVMGFPLLPQLSTTAELFVVNLTKEGNSLLRYLWTEATMHAVRKDPELKPSIGASSFRKEWAKPGLQRPAN